MFRPRTALLVALSLSPACGDTSSDRDAGDGSAGDGADGSASDGRAGDGVTGDGAEDGSPSGDGASGDGASGDGASGDGASGDGASGDGEPSMPGPDDPADGPGSTALLTGVWNEDFAFDMANYPVTWAISLVHTSMLYRAAGINYSPSAVLAIAIKESALKCTIANPANAQEQMAIKDGCFQLEAESAYPQLVQLFPERFAAPHDDVISGTHFPSAALTTFYYALFSLARFRDYRADPGDPQRFFDAHPDHQAAQKVLCGAYNRGLWWSALGDIFASCRTREVTECFGGHAIAIDHATKIADYTRMLDATTPYDVALTAADLRAYWQSIEALYPEVSDATAERALLDAFDHYRGASPTLSFHARIRQVLAALMEVLPAAPSQDDAARALCTAGQLSAANCR